MADDEDLIDRSADMSSEAQSSGSYGLERRTVAAILDAVEAGDATHAATAPIVGQANPAPETVTPAPEGKESIADFGNLDEVSETFISKVLTAPGQPYKTTATKQREQAGTTFYTMEYEVQAKNYSRAAFTTVAIKNNKLYTLTTGANMRRYKKMEDRLRTVVNSFQFIF